ncbi:toprim domain-containing protein, partial [Acinetobacter baumannii]
MSPCIRLADGEHAHLGVAEGVETALASWVFSSVPTWALRSTSGMRGFVIPSWVTKLTIFADNDMPDAMGKRAGFDAAHALAARDDVVARVRQGSLKVLVRAPSKPGTDIADLLLGIH